ncbi:MAG: Ig-like domain-containing protein [Paludibacteraceae bacterium]|nr:Ig-like domain-containing protein [Paludibacteraceae bacterium]
MKKLLTFVVLFCVSISMNADIRVLSDTRLGEGFFPRFVDAETIVYLANSNADYRVVDDNAALRVDNENLDLNLYRNGEKVVLKPHGDANYIWSSLSPNKQMILFNTKYGTAICDLNGKEIINFGQDFDAPVWYGNDYVVGMDDNHDGYYNIESSIMMASIDGKIVKRLTNPEEFGMYPNVDVQSGRIVYNTEDGEIRLLQLNLTEEPIRKEMPRLVKELDGTLLNQMNRQAKRAASTNPADYKIYINPGHGGYDSDDRLMYLYPIFIDVSNSTLNSADGYTREQSFWESTSNLDKGLRLDTILRDLGFQTKMSRVTNTTADDRSLSGISAEASNWNADFMLSIHSNAGNPSNYILHLHSGITPGDPYGLNGYPEKVPEEICNEARAITTLMGANQYSNQVSCWSREPNIAGDKTFARTIMGWPNGYGVMRNLKVPGTISEGMMHDYLPETYRLMNIDYKRQESFQFAKTFIQYFCDGELPYGAIGGKIYDMYLKQEFPNYRARKGTRDEYRPILKGVVELWQNDQLLQTYVTDTLYNGVYYFWNLQPGTYTVKAKPEGYYPQEQTLEVKQNEISYGIFAMSMVRETPPEVIDYSPKVEITDSVIVSTNVTISFNWDMETEATAAALTITPAVEGTIIFEDDCHTLRFKPATRFEPGVEYTVTLGTGACHPDTTFENHLQEPFSFKFRTDNRSSVRVIQTYPTKEEVNVPLNASFIVLFDAEIVPSILKKGVEVLDAEGNLVKINTRSFKCNTAPAPYGYAAFELVNELEATKDYSFVLKPSISDVDAVLLNETITIPFHTGEKVVSTLPLVDEMDNAFFVGDKENSTDVQSANAMRYTNKMYAGLASNQLSYAFSGPDGEALFNAINPMLVIGNSESKLGMYVFGDYSFNELYARWAVEGDIKYTKLCTLDYAGWLYQEADMSELPAGVDYQFMGLRLVRKEGIMSESGTIYIDNLHAEYVAPTAVDNIFAPDENTQKIIKDGYLHILLNGVKYNAQGAVVK